MGQRSQGGGMDGAAEMAKRSPSWAMGLTQKEIRIRPLTSTPTVPVVQVTDRSPLKWKYHQVKGFQDAHGTTTAHGEHHATCATTSQDTTHSFARVWTLILWKQWNPLACLDPRWATATRAGPTMLVQRHSQNLDELRSGPQESLPGMVNEWPS